MDHKSLAKTLKLAKKRFEDKNNVFFKSLDAKIAGEMKFRASICRMLKSADSLLDMLQLCDELEDAGMHNIDAKKNLKALMNLSEKLKIESSLSRKRLKNLEKFANEIRCDFGIKPIKPILIPDSPPRPIRKSTRNNQIVSWISKEPMKSTDSYNREPNRKSNETMIDGIRALEQSAIALLKVEDNSNEEHIHTLNIIHK